MNPRIPTAQIFYEPLELETSSPIPFIPFIVGKTLPDADYASGPFSEEKNSFNLFWDVSVCNILSFCEIQNFSNSS